MGQLPTELVDMIVLKMDVRTLGVLYDRGTLKDMVSAPAAQEIEEKVLQRAQEEHERLLSFVHNDMIYIYNYIHGSGHLFVDNKEDGTAADLLRPPWGRCTK